MHLSISRTQTASICLLFVFGLLVAPATGNAQLTLQESGYTVTDLGSSVGAKGLECSPGGVWGDYVYIADSGGDVIERVDYFDNVSLFASLSSPAFPVGMEFGPGPAADFGTYMYVAKYSGNSVIRIDPSGTVSPWISITSPSDVEFDPTGGYGTELFVAQAYSGPIYKVDNAGTPTVWSTVPSLYMKFGPGGAWGTGMYATSQTAVGIVTIDAAGVPTNFATGFTNPEGFDWGYGPGFDGDMFATDVTDGKVWRIQDDGTKTLWADLPQAADAAFCNGALYLVTFHTGECYKVEPEEPVSVAFTRVRAVDTDGAVRVSWNVATDEDISGFTVYRGNLGETNPGIAVSDLLSGDSREFLDATAAPGAGYRYRVAARMPDGGEIMSSPTSLTLPRVALSMSQNYPNPFNPTTTIDFSLPSAGDVTLSVYDGQGRLVVDLVEGARPGGRHSVTWDGLDARGNAVASGVYFYRLTSATRSITRKLVVLK